MKKIAFVLTLLIAFSACDSDDDNNAPQFLISVSHSHNWDGENVSSDDIGITEFTNENGEVLKITRLRYLISKVILTNSTGDEISIEGTNDYNLVDLSDNNTLNYATNIVVPPGTYTKISFVYGFNEEDNLARRKVVVVGSKVPQELKTRPNLLLGKQITIAGVSYEVIGILKEEGSTGWQSPDEELYVPILTAAQRIFGRIRVDSINVGIANDANIEQVMMSIERILRQQHDIGPGQDNDFRIADSSQFSDLRRDATSIFTFLIAGIAAISLLVGGIGVMNIMLVSVTERTREIGLRKALGASKSVIMLQFIVEAILLCGIGGIIGVLIGTSLLALLTSIFSWPFEMPLTAIVGSISFSALVGLFFGIWPANKAAKLDPVIALRHE
mgnify:CR=1 FL=1